MVGIYVDDVVVIGEENTVQNITVNLQKRFTVTVEKEVKKIVGCEVFWDMEKISVVLKKGIIEKLKSQFKDELSKLSSLKTPAIPMSVVEHVESGEPIQGPIEHESYQSGVGMLLYLIKHSRPDISNNTRDLSKCMKTSGPIHQKNLLRAIKYVTDTKEMGVLFQPIKNEKEEWCIEAFSDSDWAAYKRTRRSVSRWEFFYCNALISWRS